MYNKSENAIDFYKYLKCLDCKKAGSFCKIHELEVNKILEQIFKEAYDKAKNN